MNRKRIIAIAVAAATVIGSSAVFVPEAFAQGRHRDTERHPEIRRAMKALQNARKDLTDADRDFGGHRTDAVKAIDEALDQCKRAIAYDKH